MAGSGHGGPMATAAASARELPFEDLAAVLLARHKELETEHRRLKQELTSLQVHHAAARREGEGHDLQAQLASMAMGEGVQAVPAEAPAEGRSAAQGQAIHRRGSDGEHLGSFARTTDLDSAEELYQLEIWPLWEDEAYDVPISRNSFSHEEVSVIISATMGSEAGNNNSAPWFMLYPDSPKRILWDAMAMIVLCYDIMMTPLMAFEFPSNVVTYVFDLATTTFWTCDMVMSFCTGYRQAYTFEMRPCYVARHYLRSAFGPDLVIGVGDWIMYGLESNMAQSPDIMRFSKVIRLTRVFRVMRLMRLLRLPTLFNNLMKQIQSDVIRALAQVTSNLIAIIFVNHLVACLWYTMRLVGKPSWTDLLDEEQRSTSYRYMTAMHWSITQFTPASMEVQPRNTLERAFAIFCVFFGLVMFSSFVSSITMTMASLRLNRLRETSTKEMVMRYMSERGVSIRLGVKILDFLGSYKFGERPVHRKDISILAVLPKNLQLMLDWEVNNLVLARHPMLHHISETDDISMLMLCNLAEELTLTASEELFNPGTLATRMYFTLSGILHCFHGFTETEPLPVQCAEHRWLCEPALWVRWRHRGRAVAATACSLITLGGDGLQRVVVTRTRLRRACMIYARLLREELQKGSSSKSLRQWQLDFDMSGDFRDDLDRRLELAHAAFETVEEELGPCVSYDGSLSTASSKSKMSGSGRRASLSSGKVAAPRLPRQMARSL